MSNTKYHVIAKRHADSIPQRAVISAKGIMEAIQKLCAMMGVASTVNIADFEILEVLGNDKYRMAARKSTTGEAVLDKSKLPAVSEKPKVTHGETTYTSYKVRAA